MYWKIVTNDFNFLLSLSVSVMKERLSWNWNMKARKKKTPSLVLLVNMVVEETWADRGVTLDTSASKAFLHRPSCISNSVDKTKLPRADRTTTPRKTSIKNMN